MLIILQTSRAEERAVRAYRALKQVEEFSRLYGAGLLSQTTLLSQLFTDVHPLRLVFESAPMPPNPLWEMWQRSIREPSRVVAADALTQAVEWTREQHDE